MSAITYTKIESAFNNSIIPDELWRFKYHILMLYRMISGGADIPHMNSKKMNEYCNRVLDSIKNEEAFLSIFYEAINIIRNTSSEIDIKDRKACERKSTMY